MQSTNVTFTETSLEEETNLYFLLYSLLLSKLSLMQVTQNKFKVNLVWLI